MTAKTRSGLWRALVTRRAVVAGGLAALGLLTGGLQTGLAQSDDFFAGKTIDLYIGNEAGASYDLYARLMAKHIVRFIPGHPGIVPRNMPGAGGMLAMNYLYDVAKRDGTAWGVVDRGLASEPLLYGKDSKAAFKTTLDFNWVGSLNTEIGVAAVWHTTGITSWEQIRTRPVIVPMQGAQGGVGARALNRFLGTKFEQVCCYAGDGSQNLAMERGEVEGRVGWSWSSLKLTHTDWLESGKIKLLMQVGLQKNPEIPADVPLVVDVAPTEKDRKALSIIFSNQSMGRPVLMPPGVPAARVAAIRRAFMDMVKDRDFLADAKKQNLEITDPKSGEEIQQLLKELYGTPPDVVLAAQAAMKEGESKAQGGTK
jgi:tripartite-type tricarboxylate transporter receptor subunit TctC